MNGEFKGVAAEFRAVRSEIGNAHPRPLRPPPRLTQSRPDWVIPMNLPLLPCVTLSYNYNPAL